MAELTRILSYGEFYDVPRLFVVTVDEGLLVFDSPFDEDLDEYRPDYAVYFLPWSEARRLHGRWDTLTEGAEHRGVVPVSEVEFDESRRRLVSATVVNRFVTPTP